MASIDFAKYTKQQADGMKVHFDERCRKDLNHANKHIDPERAHLNYFIGCNSYQEMKDNAENRVKHVDKIQPPKRIKTDRKTVVIAEIPCPLAIEKQGQADEFFRFTYEQLQAYFGNDNIAGMTVHKDEKHTYIDNGIEKESLFHGHAMIVPYTKEHGVNCKNFLTRNMLLNFHAWYNEKVLERFGIEYLTHERARRKTVEQLKESTELEAVRKELKEAYVELEDVRNDIGRAKNVKKKLFSERNGYAQYSVAEVEQIKAERDYYKKALDEVEMKQQFQQNGQANYHAGIVSKMLADGQEAINKRNLARIQEVQRNFPLIVERETKKQVEELINQMQCPNEELKPYRRIINKMIEEQVQRNTPNLDTHEFEINFEHE